VAVENRQMVADTGQISKLINGPKQVILRNVIIYRKLVKQGALRLLFRSQHQNYPLLLGTIEQVTKPQMKKSFSTKLALGVEGFFKVVENSRLQRGAIKFGRAAIGPPRSLGFTIGRHTIHHNAKAAAHHRDGEWMASMHQAFVLCAANGNTEYPLWSSAICSPFTIYFNQGVSEFSELSHDSC
jgi:hypothetical protein